jgi:MtaA/CmuA family methyltransferase
MSRQLFLDAVSRNNQSPRAVFGTATSIACQDLMDVTGAHFPESHLEPRKMADLAIAGHTELGLDVVMPLFSVCHDAAAIGSKVNWGSDSMMPESGKPIFKTAADIRIPDDLLTRPGCTVPLEAIGILKQRLGDSAAVCGKVFGGWTLAYHCFGVENFLIGTLDDPDETRRILERLMPVAVRFAQAQLDAGADCIMLGDHATRDLCSPRAYQEFVAPMHRELAQRIKGPVVLHICGDTSDRIEMISQTGLDCFHWDTKTGSPQTARRLAGDRISLMGGISNFELLKSTPESIRADAIEAVRGGIDIVGPECAIPLTTPLENLKAVASIGRDPLD